MTLRKRNGFRRAAAAIALSGALAAGGVGVSAAQASSTQSAFINAQQSQTFNTYFFGKTEVCIQNWGVTFGNAAFEWWSSTSYGSGALTPKQQTCFTKSFAGFQIKIYNNSVNAPLLVTFPIGP